jgi:hypothetical protein
MLGVLRPIIPFGTPSIFWTKTLYHLPSAIEDAPKRELLKTINDAMQSLPAQSGQPRIAPFTESELELGEVRVFKTALSLDPSKLAIGSAHPRLPVSLIVQVSISLDFAQWTFILDLGKDELANWRYTRFGPVDSSAPAPADWRSDFLAQVDRICGEHEQAVTAVPTASTAPSASSQLLDVCYEQIWEQFRVAYPLVDAIVSSKKPRTIIHEARGLALSTRGLHTDGTPLSDQEARTITRMPLTIYPRFLGKGGEQVGEPNEANATLNAFWPMAKTMTPDISERQYVACGVLGFKALLISALGSPTRAPTTSPANELANRVLFITKAEPEPTQLARIVDRLVALELYAAYSLWHDEILLKADKTIMRLGRELDEDIREWTEKQAAILKAAELRYEEASREGQTSFRYGRHYRAYLARRRAGHAIEDEPYWLFSPLKRLAHRGFVNVELYRIDDVRDAEMASASEDMNKKLTNLAHEINRVGVDTSTVGMSRANVESNVPFMVARSRLYSEYFNSILPTFQGGNIDTWLSYDSFGRRGRTPRQNAIDRTGVRINNLNRRLQAITELIQTSALIWQTTATRSNTSNIRRVLWQVAVTGTFLYAIFRFAPWGWLWNQFVEWLWRVLAMLPAGA